VTLQCFSVTTHIGNAGALHEHNKGFNCVGDDRLLAVQENPVARPCRRGGYHAKVVLGGSRITLMNARLNDVIRAMVPVTIYVC